MSCKQTGKSSGCQYCSSTKYTTLPCTGWRSCLLFRLTAVQANAAWLICAHPPTPLRKRKKKIQQPDPTVWCGVSSSGTPTVSGSGRKGPGAGNQRGQPSTGSVPAGSLSRPHRERRGAAKLGTKGGEQLKDVAAPLWTPPGHDCTADARIGHSLDLRHNSGPQITVRNAAAVKCIWVCFSEGWPGRCDPAEGHRSQRVPAWR